MNYIYYLKLDVSMRCMEDAVRLPAYLGSTIRGAMGTAMKAECCTKSLTAECAECDRSDGCSYAYIFTNQSKEDAVWLKNIPTKPNPFVIEPPMEMKTDYAAGEELRFSLLLFGRAGDYLSQFLTGLLEMATGGLGIRRARFRLLEVKCGEQLIYRENRMFLSSILQSPKQVYIHASKETASAPGSSQLSVRFITPLRYVDRGEIKKEINFEVLMRSILRRCSLISGYYCGCSWEMDYERLLDLAGKVGTFNMDLGWRQLNRYSNRAKEKMDISGITGYIQFQGELSPFMPYLKMGEITHIGKGCTMGLGKYTLC